MDVHLLKSLRYERSLSQEELARMANVATMTISRLERGQIKQPYPSTVRKLAAALKVPVATLRHVHTPEQAA